MQQPLKRLITALRLYSVAAWLYETWRLLARPHTYGALVAIWWDGKLLLVESSYRRSWSLPGGGINRDETARQAAARELREEMDLVMEPAHLVDPWTTTEHSARGTNTVTIFALKLQEEPAIQIDGLEIVAWHWLRHEDALTKPLTSHLRTYLLKAQPAAGAVRVVGAGPLLQGCRRSLSRARPARRPG